MNKYVQLGYNSRDTSPIIKQHKWLCHTYLKEICGPGWKQLNLRIKSCTMWLIKIIRQIKVINTVKL